MVSFADCQKAIARIYDKNQKIIGTGFLVSSRYLITCAHVVVDALGIDRAEIPTEVVSIDFPQMGGKKPIERIGKIILWNPCSSFFETRSLDKAKFGEDIALLELDLEISTEIKELEIFLIEDFSEQPEFFAYGFPEGNDSGELTKGEVVFQTVTWLQLQGKYSTLPIRPGFSGCPIFFDTKQGIKVVGMAVATKYDSQEEELEKDKAYAIPATALAEIWFKQGLLIECLAGCDRKLIERAYNCCSERKWTVKRPESIAEYVKVLYQYSQENEAKNYLLDFVIYLHTKTDISESLRDKLRKWAEKAYQVDSSEFVEKCDRLNQSLEAEQSSQESTVDSRLWIIFNESGADDLYRIESVYFIQDINCYDRHDSETYENIELKSTTDVTRSQLQDSKYIFADLQEIVDRVLYDPSLRIEFFLPYKSLDLTPDSWLIEDEFDDEPYAIGSQYPVSIRILERLGYKKNYRYASAWKDNWQFQYIQQLSQDGLVCCELSPDEIANKLRDENILGLRCLSPIQTHKNKPAVTIMRAGIPIALWFRQELSVCCGEENYQRILETCLTKLSVELCDTRKAEPTNKKHMARHISLIWDNPTKLPFDAPTFSDRKI